jgi:hypothetical protein
MEYVIQGGGLTKEAIFKNVEQDLELSRHQMFQMAGQPKHTHRNYYNRCKQTDRRKAAQKF